MMWRTRSAAFLSRLRFYLVRAGWPSIAGVFLLLVGSIIEFLVIPHEQAAVTVARTAAGDQRTAYLQAQDAGHQGTSEAVETLEEFRETLLPEANVDEALEFIQRAALSRGLLPGGTEYKWQHLPAAKLAVVRITLPLKGSYGSLRGFVQDVFSEHAGLALEQFDMQRDSIASSQVEARLRFVLFLRVES